MPMLAMVSSIKGELRTMVAPETLAPTISAGLIAGVITSILAISFAALIFSGDLLAPSLGTGVVLALLSASCAAFLVAVFSSFPGTLAFPQDKIAPLLALLSAGVVAALPPGATPVEAFATVMGALVATALCVGVFLSLIGAFRLGFLIRFIPYPVIGGFLAGNGYLLLKGSLKVMTGQTLTLHGLPALLSGPMLVKWAGGALFAVTLLLLTRKVKHLLTMPLALAGGIGLFYAVIALAGVDIAQARELGLLLGPFPPRAGLRLESLSALGSADWAVVAGRIGAIGTIMLVSAVGVLLNASALELASRRDIDLNRELKVAGGANLLMGGIGGLVSFHTLSLSLLVLRMGKPNRLVGILVALVSLLVLLIGTDPLLFFPRPIVGGVLGYLGLSFLVEWLVDGFSRLNRADWIIIIIILLVIGGVGYLEGVGVGVIACVVVFLVNYSRVDVVKHELSARFHRSNVDRPRSCRLALQEHGRQACALKLQGYLFFGTANSLLERVRTLAADPAWPDLRYIVLDFAKVSGIDSSAVISFVKMEQFCQGRGMVLTLCSLSPRVERKLSRDLVFDREHLQRFEDLDHALEWCEGRILSNLGIDADAEAAKPIPMVELFGEGAADVMERYLVRQEASEGSNLFSDGQPSDCLYLIVSGRLTVWMKTPSGGAIRLRTVSGGSVVGEMGLYQQHTRSATVVADMPSTVLRLSGDALERMQREDPAMAAAFHRWMVRLMAERLGNANLAVRSLLE